MASRYFTLLRLFTLVLAITAATAHHLGATKHSRRALLGDDTGSSNGGGFMSMFSGGSNSNGGMLQSLFGGGGGGSSFGSGGNLASLFGGGSASTATTAATTTVTADAQTVSECQTLAEVATGAGLSILVEAVTAAGGPLLDAVTSSDTAVTVFAPTDQAFADALSALGVSKEELLGDTELLTSVLQYHVHGAPVQSADLSDGMELTTLFPGDAGLTVAIADGAVTIEGVGSKAQVVTPDVEACKSVVHVIDNVLLPISLAAEQQAVQADAK